MAELVCKCIPCAERARFLKTGGEAAAACIKLARHATGRDLIVQIGYNGWLNSLAAGTRILPGQEGPSVPPGVPRAIAALHRGCGWNDTEGVRKVFEESGKQIAAVVISADYARMEEGRAFYPFLREITTRYGALLVHDEIVTGFRVALGGVQEYFGVTPDLAVFAKGIANGMPLSVYCGKADVMDRLSEAIVSSTYGGEALSLAAAKATITTYRNENVIAHFWRMGERLTTGERRSAGTSTRTIRMPSGSSIHISISPQGSAAGARITGTPAAVGRTCSSRTSRTWIQIITDRPAGPTACPETSRSPEPRKNTTPGSSGAPNSR